MSETVIATDGAQIPLASVAQNFEYSGSFPTRITLEYQGRTYWQLFANDGSNVTYISNWLYIENPSTQDYMITETGELMLTENNQPMLME